MKQNKSIDRRQFISRVAIGSGVLLAGLPALSAYGCSRPAGITSGYDPESFEADVEIDLTAAPDETQIFPGRKTEVWRYTARVRKGPASTVQNLPGTFTGPVFRFRKGDRVKIYFHNELPDKTVVHWHGLHVPQEADGHPRYVIGNGKTYVYAFEVMNRAGTYWFHPHPHGQTGPQVYRGLAGLFLITDDEEEALGLPAGNQEIPVVIQDRIFDNNNQLVYLRSRMDRMTGFLGNRILVNGQPDALLSLAPGTYRFRVLNGSNSRIYKLAWADGTPLTVIGTDGGLLEAPVRKQYIMLGPAERVDLWVDLADRKAGEQLTLKSLPFSGGSMSGMMGGGMMGGGMMGRGNRNSSNVPDNGDELTLLKIRIKTGMAKTGELPAKLSTIQRYDPAEAVNKNNPRAFHFTMQGMNPVINGRTFQMTKVARDEIVRLDTTEIWRLINDNTGMMGNMMQMPHPVHIHGLSFLVLNRTKPATGWDTIKEGFVDQGWKDTVLLMPGMKADVIMRFEDFPGLFLYHCHNLEHEDLGMMRNYLVQTKK